MSKTERRLAKRDNIIEDMMPDPDQWPKQYQNLWDKSHWTNRERFIMHLFLAMNGLPPTLIEDVFDTLNPRREEDWRSIRTQFKQIRNNIAEQPARYNSYHIGNRTTTDFTGKKIYNDSEQARTAKRKKDEEDLRKIAAAAKKAREEEEDRIMMEVAQAAEDEWTESQMILAAEEAENQERLRVAEERDDRRKDHS